MERVQLSFQLLIRHHGKQQISLDHPYYFLNIDIIITVLFI